MSEIHSCNEGVIKSLESQLAEARAEIERVKKWAENDDLKWSERCDRLEKELAEARTEIEQNAESRAKLAIENVEMQDRIDRLEKNAVSATQIERLEGQAEAWRKMWRQDLDKIDRLKKVRESAENYLEKEFTTESSYARGHLKEALSQAKESS